jgi:hypothetical protein
MWRHLLACWLSFLACSCTGDDGERAAADAFRAFESALRRGDPEAARATVTEASAAALTELPWTTLRQALPRPPLGVQRTPVDWRVAVADPDSPRPAQFVVVREHGRHVVDLVATAGLYTEVRAVEASGQGLQPRALTPADHDRIREFALSRPGR